MTPGIKTTEFWFLALATVAGLVMASGLLPHGGLAEQIIGGIVSVLGSLGYAVSRTILKKNE